MGTVTISGTKFTNNTSVGWLAGGAIAIADDATVNILNQTLLQGNVALQENSGGAISVNQQGTLAVSGNSVLDRNNATANGGAIAVYDSGHLDLNECVVSNNKALNNSGGGSIALFGNGTAVIADTVFDGNRAMQTGAGNLAVYDDASVIISHCVIKNSALVNGHGAGLFCHDRSRALITNRTVFTNNTGGALSLRGDCVVNITGASSIVNNTPFAGFGGGGVLATEDSLLIMQGQSVLAGNVAMEGPGGGGIEANAHATVVLDGVDVYGNEASNGGGVYASGNATLNITGGTSFRNNTAQVGPDMNVGPRVELNVQGDTIDLYGKGVVWMRSDCVAGEVLDQGYCRKCLPSTYSLDPMGGASCSVCPGQANCTGGDVIIPLQGFWHSSSYSTQIHRCRHVDQVCLYNGTCQSGYQGHLCGECEAGYGSTGSFDCGACLPLRVQWVVYLCAALVAVLVVAVTVHATWQDNQDASQAVRVSDMIKIMVLFLQYLVVISSLSVPWPGSLSILYKVVRFIFAATNGMVVSLDCLLVGGLAEGSIPIAVQRKLIYLLAPLAVLLGVVLLYTTLPLGKFGVSRALGRGSSLSLQFKAHPVIARLPVMCIVVFFFAYPSLLRASLGFFACLKLDDVHATGDPYPQYAIANATHGYYVHAMQQACWEGWHYPWALALGLPCTIIFCLVVPAALALGMFKQRAKLKEVSFRRHFGFLYRNFRQSRCWWEGVLAMQTVLLVSVAVFRYSLGGYFSVLLMSVMFGGSATLQLLFRPFAQRKLHRLQLVATGCLYLTTCFALSLFTFDVDSSAAFKEAVGALVVVVNCCFLLWCCFLIARQSQPVLARWGLVLGRCLRCFSCCSASSAGGSVGSSSTLSPTVSSGLSSPTLSGTLLGAGGSGPLVEKDPDQCAAIRDKSTMLKRSSPIAPTSLPHV